MKVLGKTILCLSYQYFSESNGVTDDRFLSVSISDIENNNYPDNPLVFRNVVGSRQIAIADKTDKQNYRTPSATGTAKTGRADLTFTWRRVSESQYRIDPSISNIHDIFVLTQNYDVSFREWINNDRIQNTIPSIPSEIDLENQFENIAGKKTQSDTIVYRPAGYRIIFGELAAIDLRGNFRVVPVTGTSLTDNEIKTRILEAINDFFQYR